MSRRINLKSVIGKANLTYYYLGHSHSNCGSLYFKTENVESKVNHIL